MNSRYYNFVADWVADTETPEVIRLLDQMGYFTEYDEDNNPVLTEDTYTLRERLVEKISWDENFFNDEF